MVGPVGLRQEEGLARIKSLSYVFEDLNLKRSGYGSSGTDNQTAYQKVFAAGHLKDAGDKKSV